jgi:hypothetical protein
MLPVYGWSDTESSPAAAAKAASAAAAPEEAKEGSQEEAKEDECPSTFGPIITDTAVPVDKGKFVIQPTWGLGFTTNTLSPSWRRISAGGNFTSFSTALKLTYGLWNNLEVFTVIPYIHNWAGKVDTPGPNGERSANFGGIGDITLTAKYRLVEEGPVMPTITGLLTTGFPTGHFRNLNPSRLGTEALGGGAYTFTAGLNLSKFLKPFIFYGNLWYTMQTDFISQGQDELGNPASIRNHPRDYVTVNMAMEYPITKKWIALLELYSTWDGGRLMGPKANLAPTALFSILPGIEFMATEKYSLALGVGIDFIGKNGNANVTPMLSMVYAF